MAATVFDPGAPLDDSKLNEIITDLAALRSTQTSISTSVQGISSSLDTSASNAVAKKLVAGKTESQSVTLTYNKSVSITVPFSPALSGNIAALIYSLEITGAPGKAVDVTSAIQTSNSSGASIALHKVTPGTVKYNVVVNYLAIAKSA
jgi:hypothetical protein